MRTAIQILVLVVVVAGLAAGGFFLFGGKIPDIVVPRTPTPPKNFIFTVVVDDAKNLDVGGPLNFRGMRVGRVLSRQLNDLGNVQYEIEVESKYVKHMRRNSLIAIKKMPLEQPEMVIDFCDRTGAQAAMDPGQTFQGYGYVAWWLSVKACDLEKYWKDIEKSLDRPASDDEGVPLGGPGVQNLSNEGNP